MDKRSLIRRKLDKDGFTLAELLVVVAIIAILVAVSIPIFTSKLEKSREATDQANERAAKAAAVTGYLSEEKVGDQQLGDAGSATVYYDAKDGKLVAAAPAAADRYGKGTDKGDVKVNHADGYIKLTVDAAGTVTLAWEGME